MQNFGPIYTQSCTPDKYIHKKTLYSAEVQSFFLGTHIHRDAIYMSRFIKNYEQTRVEYRSISIVLINNNRCTAIFWNDCRVASASSTVICRAAIPRALASARSALVRVCRRTNVLHIYMYIYMYIYIYLYI